MHIKHIKINNYRNYNEAEISFHEKMNILYGDNAQGKTNILESIYICATTKSHQGSKDKEIIKMGCDEAHVKMYIAVSYTHLPATQYKPTPIGNMKQKIPDINGIMLFLSLIHI